MPAPIARSFGVLLAAAGAWTGCGGDRSAPPGGHDLTSSGTTAHATGGGAGAGSGGAEACAEPATVSDESSLKTAFQEHFAIGVALNNSVFSGRDAARAELATKHFNRATAENAMKWALIEPSEAEFEFEGSDAFVEFAEARGMQIHGHVLVWHQQTPDWVFLDRSGDPIDRASLLARLEAHMSALSERYGSRIGSWDVVNEAFENSGALRPTPWLEIIGSDYIEQAFALADRYFPDAKLVYNDYSLFLSGKRDATIRLVESLRQAGVRIDAVGMQGHYNLERPYREELEATLDAFAAIDLEILVTELDVDVLPRATMGADLDDSMPPDPAIDPYTECVPESVDRTIAARWGELFGVFVSRRDAISGVTFWGLDDSQSWLNNFPAQGRTNYPLLFDRQLRPKSAYVNVVKQAKP